MMVDLLIRPDYKTKAGGDVVLAARYASTLQAAGARAELLPLTRQRIRHGTGAVHLFNVDRLVEFGAAARQLASSAERPVVVSPIHHPADRVEFFEREVRGGPLKIVASVGRGPVGRERVKHVLRTRSVRGVWETLVSSGNRECIGTLLASARLVAFQADGERQSVEKTFRVSLAHNSVLVPNGVEIDPVVDTAGTRDIDVLVVGRIEERKNQLRLAEALRATPWKVVFVGATNNRNPSFTLKFRRVVEHSPNLQHTHHVPLAELYRLFARSRVCASASYFEVVSLAELGSIGYGCQLVGSTSGYLAEYVGEHATFLEPTAPDDAWVSAVATARSAGVNRAGMELVRSRFSEPGVGEHLVESYANAGLLT